MVASISSVPMGPQIEPFRLYGLLFSLRATTTQLPLNSGTTTTQQLENVTEILNRLDIISARVETLFNGQSGLRDAIADLEAIRDVQLPALSALATNPTADAYDTLRNAIDSLLDQIEPVQTTLLSDPDAVRTALENARDIINGSEGVVGGSSFYNRFASVAATAVDPVTNPTITNDVIANFDATATGTGSPLADSAPNDAVDNSLAAPGAAATPAVTPSGIGIATQGLTFDGADDVLFVAEEAGELDLLTAQRSYLIAFKTGADVTTQQILIDQSEQSNNAGGLGEGFTVLIEGGQLKFIASADTTSPGGTFNIAVRASIAANSTYVAELTFDQSSGTAELGGRLNGAAFDITPTATGAAGQTLNQLDFRANGTAIGGGITGFATDGGEQAGAGSNFGGVLGQVTIIDRVQTAVEQAETDAFLSAKYDVTFATETDPALQAQAQADIQAAIDVLSDSIATLEAQLEGSNSLAEQTLTEIEELRTLVTGSQTLVSSSRTDIFPLTMQIANPHVFGIVSGPSLLKDLVA